MSLQGEPRLAIPLQNFDPDVTQLKPWTSDDNGEYRHAKDTLHTSSPRTGSSTIRRRRRVRRRGRQVDWRGCSGRVQGRVNVGCNKSWSTASANAAGIGGEIRDILVRIQRSRVSAGEVQQQIIVGSDIVVLV